MRSVHSENGVIVLQASKVVLQISKATTHGFWYVRAILGKSAGVPAADSLPVNSKTYERRGLTMIAHRKTTGGMMKIRLLLALVGLAFAFALPTLAQQKDTVDPKIERQIRVLASKYDAAINKHDA